MTKKTKSIILRFVRGFVAGAVANMVVLLPFAGNSWSDLGTWLSALALAGSVGGLGGLILAVDKAYRT